MLLIVAWMCLMVLAQICIFRYFLQSLQNIANFGGHFCSQMNHLDVLIGVPQWQTSRCGSECRFFIWERVPHQEHQAKEGGHRMCVVTVANGAQSCWNTLKEQMSYPNGGTRELSWCIYPPVPILYWLRAASRDTNSLAVWVYHGPSHQTESSRCWLSSLWLQRLQESTDTVDYTCENHLTSNLPFPSHKMGMIKLLWGLNETK